MKRILLIPIALLLMLSCNKSTTNNAYIENDSIVEIVKKTRFTSTESFPKTIDWSKYDRHRILKFVGYYKGDTLNFLRR